MSALDKIEHATVSRRTVEVVLDGGLEEEWTRLKDKLSDAAEKDVDAGSLARPATTALVNRMEEIRDAVEASRVYFVFEQMPWQERIALQVAHPPRKNNRLDMMQGYNMDTYTPAVIKRSCVGVRETADESSELTPVPDGHWVKLLGDPDTGQKGTLNYGQVSRLYGSANYVNEELARVPISARSLLEVQDSGASLAQPSPGQAQAPSDSEAGNRRGSRKSPTTKKVASPA